MIFVLPTLAAPLPEGWLDAPAWTYAGLSSWGSPEVALADLDGDGLLDLAVGDSSAGEGLAGAVEVHLGRAGGWATAADWSWEGDYDDYLGAGVAAGDLDGDGLADLVATEPAWDSGDGTTQRGRLLGWTSAAGPLATDPDLAIMGEDQQNAWGYGEEYGMAVLITDLDDDGHQDLVVGADGVSNTYSDSGRVYLYAGASGGPGDSWDVEIEGESSNSCFGWTMGLAGDVDGDGLGDLAVGAWYDSGTGKAYVLAGESGGLPTTWSWTLRAPSGIDSFGGGLGGGDFDGDGYADVVVGPAFTDYEADHAYVFSGSATGPPANASASIPTGSFGLTAVGGAGDLDGDGFDELVAGNEIHLGGPGGAESEAAAVLALSDTDYVTDFAVGDVDGDGGVDLLFATARSGLMLFAGEPDPDADGDGWSVGDGDCDDAAAEVNPGATEVCDAVDNDCDGAVDAEDPDLGACDGETGDPDDSDDEDSDDDEDDDDDDDEDCGCRTGPEPGLGLLLGLLALRRRR